MGTHHWDRAGVERAGTFTGTALCLPFSWEIEVQNRKPKQNKQKKITATVCACVKMQALKQKSTTD